MGIKGNHVIIVELKMCLTHHVLMQTRMASYRADEAYAAVPTQPRSLELARGYGLGVLKVRETVEVLLTPTAVPMPSWHDRTISVLSKENPTDVIGGMPTGGQLGPRQRVRRSVQQYLTEHPELATLPGKVRWQKLYQEVPNHYKSATSMQQSLAKPIFHSLHQARTQWLMTQAKIATTAKPMNNSVINRL